MAHGADRSVIAGGDYSMWVGASSRDLRLHTAVHVKGDEIRAPLTLESTFAEVLSHPEAGRALLSAFAGVMGDAPAAGAMGVDMLRLMAQIPSERAVAFTGGAISREGLRALLRSAGESAQP